MNNGIKYDIIIVDYPTLLFEPGVSKEVTESGRSLMRQLTRSLKLDKLLNENNDEIIENIL